MVFLLWPGLRLGLRGDLRQIIAAAVTLGGALCWTAASVISRRSTIRISGLAAAGWQIVYGGLFNLGLLAVTRDYHGAQWGWKAWGSILYLVIFGSVVTYTAYIYLLDNVAVSKVATYAYVNPVIAVILGAIVLHERFVAVEYVGMGATLLAVFLVTSSKMKSGKPNVVDEDLAVEAAGLGTRGLAARVADRQRIERRSLIAAKTNCCLGDAIQHGRCCWRRSTRRGDGCSSWWKGPSRRPGLCAVGPGRRPCGSSASRSCRSKAARWTSCPGAL